MSVDSQRPSTLVGYRLYITEERHMGPVCEFEATLDRLAIKHANDVRKGRAAELWCRTRRVTTFDATLGEDTTPEHSRRPPRA